MAQKELNKTKKQKFLILTSIVVLLTLLLGTAFGITNAEEYIVDEIPLDQTTYNSFLKRRSTPATLPSSYDARNYGLVTSVKDQGWGNGTCWAFAAVAALESHILKLRTSIDPSEDISEQQLVSCNTAPYRSSPLTIKCWETQCPIQETCFSYVGQSAPCGNARTDGYYCKLPVRINNFHTINTSSPEQVKRSILQSGPTYFRFDVYTDFPLWYFLAWSGSVYENAAGTSKTGGHAVEIIGWDDAKGAYLCKNSWGAITGPQNDGTFWIAYSGHANNLYLQMANFDFSTLVVLYPDHTSNLKCGTEIRILWGHYGVGRVNIDLGQPGGCGTFSWTPIATNIDGIEYQPNVAYCRWTVPQTPQSGCYIRITSVDSPELSHTSQELHWGVE